MMKLTSLVLLLVSASSIVNAQSSTVNINTVTTAVPFLRIAPDARAGSMGDIGVSTAPDEYSSFWNVAKAPFNTKPGGVGITYTPWLKDLGLNDVYLASLSGFYKISEDEALTSSLRYFSLGSIQFTDNLGNDLSQARPNEFAVDLGYSRKLSSNLAMGLALRYIYSNLTGGNANFNGISYKAGTSVAADLTMFYTGIKEDGSGFNYGVALTNLGTKISYTSDASQKDYIPANLGLGISYTKAFDETSKITFGLDINKLMVPTPPLVGDSAGLVEYRSKSVVSSWFSSFADAPGGFSEELQEFQLSVGTEFWYLNQFAVRAGYFYENPAKGNRQYFTAGAGLKYNTFGINFSYLIPSGNGITRNPLSNTLRFSLLFDIGEKGEK